MRKFLIRVSLVSLAASCAAYSAEDDLRVPLPDPEVRGEMSLEEAIERRRSVREFGRRSLMLDDVSQLLWAAQGVTGERNYRSAPSAGALYPLELYLVAGDVDGLSPGVYRYRPEKHDLVPVASGDRRARLATAALGQRWVRRAPAVMLLAGVYERSMGKYGARGRRYTHIEVGHAAQNVYLQATARGLRTVMVGAFDDDDVQEALELPQSHKPLGLMPVGR